MRIKYYNKDYPKNNINTLSLANYYMMEYNLVENKCKLNLTDDEKDGNFKIVKLKIDEVINILENSIKYSTRPVVVRDTILVMNEFLKIKENNYVNTSR